MGPSVRVNPLSADILMELLVLGSIGAAAWWSVALDDSESEEEQALINGARRREVVSVTVERRARAHCEMVAVPKPAYLIVRGPWPIERYCRCLVVCSTQLNPTSPSSAVCSRLRLACL